MKRFHVHLHVDDLSRSIGFYSQLFAAQPARIEADYAKWMLEDPPVNFAVSTRGSKPGIDHLGIQTDDADELAALKARAQAADMALLDEGTTTCCYARARSTGLPTRKAWPGSTSTRWATSPYSTKRRPHLVPPRPAARPCRARIPAADTRYL